MASCKVSFILSTSMLHRTLQNRAGSGAPGDAGPGLVRVWVDLSDPEEGDV